MQSKQISVIQYHFRLTLPPMSDTADTTRQCADCGRPVRLPTVVEDRREFPAGRADTATVCQQCYRAMIDRDGGAVVSLYRADGVQRVVLDDRDRR